MLTQIIIWLIIEVDIDIMIIKSNQNLCYGHLREKSWNSYQSFFDRNLHFQTIFRIFENRRCEVNSGDIHLITEKIEKYLTKLFSLHIPWNSTTFLLKHLEKDIFFSIRVVKLRKLDSKLNLNNQCGLIIEIECVVFLEIHNKNVLNQSKVERICLKWQFCWYWLQYK